MATRQRSWRVAREQRVVLPTALEEEVKLKTACSWGRNHLELLGVEFHLKRRIDLNRVFRVKESN